MDGFDGRLRRLLTAYGEGAVTTYDAAAIAHAAASHRSGSPFQVGVPFGTRVRITLLVALLALLALGAAWVAGSLTHDGLQRTIVLGPTGPEHDVYRVPGGPTFELTIENRSDVTWVPWSGLAEKFGWCHVISGSSAVPGDPCTVGPHSTIVLRPPPVVPAGTYEIDFAPVGRDFHTGIPVMVDVVPQP